MNKIVPFGKYKGMPIGALAQDKEYTQWLLSQAWLKENYKDTYTLIINNFGEPNETPEHNALQALFLENNYALGVLRLLPKKKSIFEECENIKNEVFLAVEQLKIMKLKLAQKTGSMDWENYWRKDLEKIQTILNNEELEKIIEVTQVRFECGCDVKIQYEVYPKISGLVYDIREIRINSLLLEIKIEVKPIVGDDYPAVLRKMRVAGISVLFIEEFNAIGVNREQFIEIFGRSGIAVIFKKDVQPINSFIH